MNDHVQNQGSRADVQVSGLRSDSNSGLKTQDSGPNPSQRAWIRFRQNRPAFLSAWLLAALILIVLAWPVALKLSGTIGPGGARSARDHYPDTVSCDQSARRA